MSHSRDHMPSDFLSNPHSARLVVVDCEVVAGSGDLIDFGAVDMHGERLHSSIPSNIRNFLKETQFLCGHNIVAHDMKYVAPFLDGAPVQTIDTLALSALLFPQKRFHALLKDEKLQTTELNNPLTDAIKAKDLLAAEFAAFAELPETVKQILASLLKYDAHFSGFFAYLGQPPVFGNFHRLIEVIRQAFDGKICTHADLSELIISYPVELGFVLAFISAEERAELLPAWVERNYPKTEIVLKALRETACRQGCEWCRKNFQAENGLKKFFGFEHFRTYDGEPLQEQAAQAALDGESLLAVFPTGGGKSITFQIPALMQAEATKSLTVVLSPLQSLMKDQVDHLREAGIEGAYTINGMLSPIERSRTIEAIYDGSAKILYISPEQLRSRTIEEALKNRRIARFVIDEAHCFSAWGHDFRVDYLYIGDFIARLQKLQGNQRNIPVSCFTATAKQKVVTDICDYFRKKLNLELRLFTTRAARRNLHYKVIHAESAAEKYAYIRGVVAAKKCPTIIYVSRTKATIEIANRLNDDGFRALAFHGKMESSEKIQNQEAFLSGDIDIMVATNAFGMGVDKKDVGLVIHYDISASLENYVQEAGRAGRDPNLQAECYVLFNESDLDGHFSMLTQTKLSQADIQMVWKGIKNLTKSQNTIAASALEIAREAGWDIQAEDLETRIKTALAALETAGYILRGRNVPRVFASSIAVDTFEQAKARIIASPVFEDEGSSTTAQRIIRSLISSRTTHGARGADAESRVDYLADRLGIKMEEVIRSVNQLRMAGILHDLADMTVCFEKSANLRKTLKAVRDGLLLEKFILDTLVAQGEAFDVNLKELNGRAQNSGLRHSNIKLIHSMLRALKRSGFIQRLHRIPNTSVVRIRQSGELSKALDRHPTKTALCEFIVQKLYRDAALQLENSGEFNLANMPKSDNTDRAKPVTAAFSTVGLLSAWKKDPHLSKGFDPILLRDVEDVLLWLGDIGAMRLQGGFMVLYQGLTIQRLVTNNQRQYRVDDYRQLDQYYQQKLQQIHIVGEYANLMMRDYDKALQYVHDYFALDYEVFLKKYFAGDRRTELKRSMTPRLFAKLFDGLSPRQFEIIDSTSRFVVVSAGPGSGKTRVLVHKLAAMLTLEDVRPEQLLMLTFSRAAATEFKKRLIDLIGRKAYYVDIKTFHSYAFDVLGELGSLETASNVVARATEVIRSDHVDVSRISKTTLVIDEAQDMDAFEFDLVRALIDYNETMRVIAVGDDDQNIYAFRGADSKYLRELIVQYDAEHFEMVENWRSCEQIVAFSNQFVKTIRNRMKHFSGTATRPDAGVVKIVRHLGDNFEIALANDLLACINEGSLVGSTAVLTATNDEDYRIAGFLTDHGVRAQSIQGQREVMLYNFVEVRSLLQFMRRQISTSAVVTESVWNQAKDYLKQKYACSPWTDNVLRLMKSFESVSPKEARYFSDFEEFVRESTLEDTYAAENGVVMVSTMHKAKGREFDNVFLLATRSAYPNDADKRTLYVALTRAKNRLTVHAGKNAFDEMKISDVEFLTDETIYPKPETVTLALTHEDVWLDFFIKRRHMIFTLESSQPLLLEDDGFSVRVDGQSQKVVRYSKAFVQTLEKWRQQGYEPMEAWINMILAWKKQGQEEESDKEYPIVLPKLKLRKSA